VALRAETRSAGVCVSLCVYMHGRMALRAVGLQVCVCEFVCVYAW